MRRLGNSIKTVECSAYLLNLPGNFVAPRAHASVGVDRGDPALGCSRLDFSKFVEALGFDNKVSRRFSL